MLAEEQAKGLDPDEAMEVWEYMRPSVTEELLEDDDAARVDAGMSEWDWEEAQEESR